MHITYIRVFGYVVYRYTDDIMSHTLHTLCASQNCNQNQQLILLLSINYLNATSHQSFDTKRHKGCHDPFNERYSGAWHQLTERVQYLLFVIPTFQ